MIKFYKMDENLRVVETEEFERRCWVDMINPTDDEVDDVKEWSGIPEEMLKAALDEEESARVDTDDGATMYVVDSPMMVDTDEGDSYTTIPVAIIYNTKCIVTVSLNPDPVLAGFRSNRNRVSTLKPVGFVLHFLLENAKRFSSLLKQIDKKSLRLQAELHRSMRNQELIELLGLQNSLVYFSTSLSANSSLYGRFSRMEAVQSNPDYQDMYDDVLIETKQATEMCHIYRDILKTTMDAFSSVISNNVNNVVKRLTIITILIAIPTLIGGLFGMNIDLPFGMGYHDGGFAWEFWVIVGLSVALTVICGVLIARMTDSVKIRTPKVKKRKRRRD
ncbi:MAG: magnesium transporter CorA family protein [Clostridia bacterium]|nr:magnesium transporter CorA family protein [Clostridia bacterium]